MVTCPVLLEPWLLTSQMWKFLKNIQEPLKDLRWKEAVTEELQALEKNETWEVVDAP